MDIKQYSAEALKTDYADYSDFNTGDSSARLDYGVMGLTTSAASLLRLIKKTKKNLNPLDREKFLEELGDTMWYMNLTLSEMGYTFEDAMQNNLTKITKRYINGSEENQKLIRK